MISLALLAIAAKAQREGQWTAFRAFAAPDAIMLMPGIVEARLFLARRKDPPVSVMWWPARTVTACDGSLALSTGPFRTADGREAGRFITLWQRQPDGTWQWIYDGGAATPVALPAGGDRVAATRAACRKPSGAPLPAAKAGRTSRDGTLRWRLDPGTTPTRHRLRVEYSNGRRWRVALDEEVGG